MIIPENAFPGYGQGEGERVGLFMEAGKGVRLTEART